MAKNNNLTVRSLLGRHVPDQYIIDRLRHDTSASAGKLLQWLIKLLSRFKQLIFSQLFFLLRPLKSLNLKNH